METLDVDATPDTVDFSRKIRGIANSFALQSCVIFLILIAGRQSIIRNPWSHNPDEGELLVAAKRAAQSIIPFDRFTTTSYGPLWPMSLAWLNHLGLPLTLPVAHLLATLLVLTTLAGTLHITRKITGRGSAFLLVFTLAIVWASGGYPRHSDYLTLATELAPLALITGGMCIAARERFHRSWALTALVLIGSAPLFKYQFGFVALGAAAVVMYDATRRDAGAIWVNLTKQSFALAFPTMIIFFVVAITGRAHFLVDEALASVSGQINRRDTPLSNRGMGTSSFLLTQAFFLLPAIVATVVALANRPDARRARWDATAMCVLFFCSYISVIEMSFRFIHYSYIVLTVSIVMTGFALSVVRARQLVTTPSRPAIGVFVAIAAVLAASYSYSGFKSLAAEPMQLRWGDVVSSKRSVVKTRTGGIDELSKVCPMGSKVFVWGWAGEMYSYYDWTPVSRYTISPWITNKSTRVRLYEKRLTGELRDELPRCIVEAIGKSFHGSYLKFKPLDRTIPQLGPFLARDYRAKKVLASGLRSRPTIEVWIRRSA